MLTPYRRHRKGCNRTSRRFKGCSCPMWAQGVLDGEPFRKSLGVTSWEAGQRKIREFEIHGENSCPAVAVACDRFIADCEARELKPESLRKYKRFIKKFKAQFETRSVRTISVDDLRSYRESWNVSASTAQKQLELMRGFFSFCMASGWRENNPAKLVKPMQVRQVPTLPYSDLEWQEIMRALERFGEKHPQTPPWALKRLTALIMLMRFTGLRISDACSLKPEMIDKQGRLFLRTEKTGKPVLVPLRKEVLEALEACDEGRPFYFWSGEGKLKTRVTRWNAKLKQLFRLAGIEDGHSHRLRDSFSVDMLNAGVPMQMVAAILGNTVRIVERHYAPWVESTQTSLEDAVKRTWV